MDTPCWDDWTFSLHERVVCLFLFSNFCSVYLYGQEPFQANSSDCGIFTLLFVLHLRHGSFNHINVPVRFIAICKTSETQKKIKKTLMSSCECAEACECGAGLAVTRVASRSSLSLFHYCLLCGRSINVKGCMAEQEPVENDLVWGDCKSFYQGLPTGVCWSYPLTGVPSSYNKGAGILVNLLFFPLEKKNTKKQKKMQNPTVSTKS